MYLALIPYKMGLNFIPETNSKDVDIQSYLYTQQSENLSNVELETNYKQLQNQFQQCEYLKKSS